MRCPSAAVLALGLFLTPVLHAARADGPSAGLPAVNVVPASHHNPCQQLFGACADSRFRETRRQPCRLVRRSRQLR